MSLSLKDRKITPALTRSVFASPMAFGHNARPALTVEFYDADGRRYLIPLTDQQAAQLGRTLARAFDQYSPAHPTVFDIEASRQRMIERNTPRHPAGCACALCAETTWPRSMAEHEAEYNAAHVSK